MSGRNTAVFGLYPDHANAENGVATLKQAGFRNTDISVLFPQNVGSKDFGHEKAHEGTGRRSDGSWVAARCWAVPWDGWSALVLWQSPAWVPSSLQDRSWPLWRGWAWGRCRRDCGRAHRPWDARIRGQARPGAGSRRRNPPFRAFGRSGLDEARQGDPGEDRSAGYLLQRRVQRRLREERQAAEPHGQRCRGGTGPRREEGRKAGSP